jgi:hypothetical protein
MTTLFAAIRGNSHTLLLLPNFHDRQSLSQLLKLADEVQAIFPGILSPHVIMKAGSDADAVPSNVPLWFDTEGRVHRLLGAADSTLILVRPDAYIGYRAQPADLDHLLKYLDGYLVRKT